MNSKQLLLSIGLTIIMLNLKAQMSGSYTINQDSVTTVTNFHSIKEAVDSMKSKGVNGSVVLTIVSGTGPYIEQVNISPIPGASATNTITLDGNGETMKYTSSTKKHTIRINGAQYIRIKNFIFFDDDGGYGVQLSNSSAYNVIENNIFEFKNSFYWSGIAIVSSICGSGLGSSCRTRTLNTTIRNNKIIGAKYGIYLNGYYSVYIFVYYDEGNIIENNIIEDCDNYGIYTTYQKNLTIHGNDISRPTRPYLNTFYGIYLGSFCNENITISANRIHNSHGGAAIKTGDAYGIYFRLIYADSSNPIRVFNNLIYDFETKGNSYGFYNFGTSNIEIAHNTVAFSDTLSKSGSAHGYYGFSTTGMSDITLYNNIFYVRKDGPDPQFGIYDIRSNMASNYNNIYISGKGSGVKYIGQNDSLYATSLSQWQGLYNFSHDTNSVSSNPIFRDIKSGLFHPNDINSLNIGTPFLPKIDFYNQLRNVTNPDPGAIEFKIINRDVGIEDIYQVNATCSGKFPLEVIIKNFGIDSAQSVEFFWEINQNFTDSAVIYTNLQMYDVDTVFLDSVNIPDSSIVKVWIKKVNNFLDDFNSNDTVVSLPVLSKMSGTYSINKNSPASLTNYQSFSALIDDLELKGICGPVYVGVDSLSGIYNEHFEIGEITGSSATNTITIDGKNNTLLYKTNKTDNTVVNIVGTDYLTIENLNISISPAASGGCGIKLSENANFNTIRKCTLNINSSTTISFERVGIIVANHDINWTVPTTVTHLTLEKNIIYGGFYGIKMNGFENDKLKGIKIIDNIVQDNIYSIHISQSDGILIDRNDISRPKATSSAKIHGIEIFTGCQNSMVSNNRIHHSNGLNPPGFSSYWTRAISIQTGENFPPAGKENHFYNNLIYKFNSNRSTIWGIYQVSSGGSRIYHNTIILDQNTTNGSGQKGIEIAYGSGSNVKVSNNNIYLANIKRKSAIGISLRASIAECNNNNIYLDTASITVTHAYGFFNTTLYSTLSDWQLADSGAFGQSSTSLDPLFRDISGFNFVPTNNSLAGSCPRIAEASHDIRFEKRDSVTTDPGAYLMAYYDDAGVKEIVDPSFSCSNKLPLRINVKNYAIDTLTQFKISWKINGNLSDTLIKGLGLAPGDSVDIVLDTIFLDSANYVDCWTSLPNGKMDERTSNDTASKYFNSSMSGYYTIDKNSIPNDTNYNSIATFADDISIRGLCGPVVAEVIAGSGPYTEQAFFDDIYGSGPVNTVLIKGNGNIISSIADTINPYTLRFNDISYLSVDSLHVTVAGSQTVFGILISGNSNELNLIKCKIQAPTGAKNLNHSGIAFYDDGLLSPGIISKYNLTIQHCEIKGGNYGIWANSASNDSAFHIINNEIINFNLEGISLHNVVSSEVISNNIHRTTFSNFHSFKGIALSFQCEKIEIRKNRIHNSHDNASALGLAKDAAGIFIGNCNPASGSEIQVVNNLIYNLNNKGVLNGILIDSSSRIKMYHNTISLDDVITSDKEVSGINVASNSGSSEIKNNIISIERGGNNSIFGLNMGGNSSYPAIDYNDVYINGKGQGSFNYGRINTTNYPNLTKWRKALSGSVGQNSSDESPGFDYINVAFIPSNVSINGKALPLSSVPQDILDSTRNVTNPDPGAFEFDPLIHDLAVYGLIMSDLSTCGDSNQMIRIVIKNNGLSRADSIPVFLEIRMNSTFDTLTYIVDSLLSGGRDTIIMGYLNTFNGGNYGFLSAIYKSNDLNRKNDSVRQSIKIHATPLNPMVSDTTICKDESVKLTIPAIAWLYRWYLDDTTSSHFNQGINYSLSPIYTDTAFYIESTSIITGCSSERVVFNVAVDNLKANFSYSISNRQNVQFTNLSTGLMDGYLWDFGDSTSTSINRDPAHVYSKNGLYSVTLSEFGTCDTASFTDTIHIDYLGISGLENGLSFSLQPNPSHGKVKIILHQWKTEEIDIIVVDMAGKTVYSDQKIGNRKQHEEFVLDLGHLQDGVYLVNVHSREGSYQQKLIIQ